MIMSNLRGRTGAGIVLVTGEKTTHSVKVLGSGIDAIDNPSYYKRLNLGVNVLIGHTRYPTKGGLGIESVHPHCFKNVIGVHNGTMRRVAKATIREGESDSSLLYADINQKGLHEAIKDAEGAYALVFLDYHKRTLNFLRNFERPMWFAKKAWDTYGKTLFWSSERAFLDVALKRNNMKDYVVEELPVNEHWSLPVPIEGPKCEFTKVTGIYQNMNVGGSGGWHRGTFLDASTQPFLPLEDKKPDASFGKETYVWREGRMVAKSDPSQQVTLPPVSSSDEHEGATKDEKAVAKTVVERVSKQQREKAAKEVQGGASGLQVPYLTLVQNGLSSTVSLDDSDEFDRDAWGDMLDDVLDDSPFDSQTEGLLVQTTRGHWITTEERERLLKEGCLWTGNPADTHDVIYWVNPREFVSEEALQDKDCMEDMAMHYPNCQLVYDWKAGKLKNVDPPAGGYWDIDGKFHQDYVH